MKSKTLIKVSLLLTAACVMLFTSCSGKKLPEVSHKLMLTAEKSNWGEICYNEDVDTWIGTVWNVYYDKTVEVYSSYSSSGDTETETYALSDEDFAELWELLNDKFIFAEEAQASDGTGWQMQFYDENGILIRDFSGYIYDIKPLERISELLTQ